MCVFTDRSLFCPKTVSSKKQHQQQNEIFLLPASSHKLVRMFRSVIDCVVFVQTTTTTTTTTKFHINYFVRKNIRRISFGAKHRLQRKATITAMKNKKHLKKVNQFIKAREVCNMGLAELRPKRKVSFSFLSFFSPHN